ncbi:MAG: CaiB/BaiF CoA-transferase family protein [Parasphingopyxis sp.]|uniref:CaiB/BaiF CoA transferase family protein n=1 Tax=Parasphingopyxis sp. TaxID=1920299 RepID=UPI0026369288|nr:CaiB/BaiF CoA-transferase family protein [uncultured Parasphingopyxis sp.]
MTDPHSGPLAGIRIVEFDAIGPVPLAGMILSDLGAEIVRIGRPGMTARVNAAGNAILMRGRKTTELDLKDPAQRDKALDLIAQADAVMEGQRPGVMERLGLGPEDCLARNPKLVYGRMTGWGQEGPLSQSAGHDIDYIAITGALGSMGRKGQPPFPPLNLVGDYGGGTMFLIMGMLAAILSAKNTGKGQVVDAAMTDGAAILMSMFYAFHDVGTWKAERESNLLDGGMPFYRCYETADGKYMAVGCLEPQFYAEFLDKLELNADDFPQHDPANWPKQAEAFGAKFKSRSRDEWAAHFEGSDACVAAVLDISEAPKHPHNVARKTFDEHDGVLHPMPAPRFSETPAKIGERGTLTIDEALAAWG